MSPKPNPTDEDGRMILWPVDDDVMTEEDWDWIFPWSRSDPPWLLRWRLLPNYYHEPDETETA